MTVKMLATSVVIALVFGVSIAALRRVREYLRAARVERELPTHADADVIGLRWGVCDVGALVQLAIGRTREHARARTVRVVGTSLAVVPVVADEHRLLQVLSKLIDHGVDLAVPGGEITVTAMTRDRDVRFEIADTGVGVLPRQIAHLFDRYHADDHPPCEGLYCCRRIVEEHGGHVGVLGLVGKGSMIWFTIPTEPERLT